jgi:hypothetical protein
MSKIIKIIAILLINITVSCSYSQKRKEVVLNRNSEINEKDLVVDSLYKVGDSRRYGIYPDSLNNKLHPKTGKPLIVSLLDFAETNNVTVRFVKGYYGLNLILDSRKNINLDFNKAEFNLLHITNEGGTPSSNINLKGSLTLYDRFGTYYSNNITADTIIVKTDTIKNLSKSKSRGCHIYKGTDNLYIKYLKVEDLASGDVRYQNNHAALAIDGLRENPTNITIDETYIISSDRHGAYITGRNNVFNKIVIFNYAQGSTDNMTGMQDSTVGEEKKLSGLWINRCNDCIFNDVEVRTKDSKKAYVLKLDEGTITQPTFINVLKLDVPYKDSIILDDIFTNILVKKIIQVD